MSPPHPLPSLLGLPPELRLQILEHTLSNTSLPIRHRNGVQWHCTSTRTPLSILQINCQIRHEIYPLFFRTIKFNLCDGFTTLELRDWMETVGEGGVGNLRKVEVFVRGRCTMFGLQPDTDYCHREAHLDLSRRKDDTSSIPPLLYNLCSNDAYGCKEQSLEALNQIGALDWHREGSRQGEKLTPDMLMSLFLALTKDNSTSVA